MKDILFAGNIVILIITLAGCSIWPKFELDKARQYIPDARSYALANIEGLSETEKSILKNSDPVIGHLNYVDYFYWWKDKKGNNFVAVRTSSPQHGFEPISASRLTKN